MPDNLSLGHKGEQIALRFLKNQGYRFIQSNFRTKVGEIDLIFEDKPFIVFVEVKTRTHNTQGLPEEAVNFRKISHITKTAQLYIQQNNLSHTPARIDVVAVEFTTNPPTIRHHKNVTG